MFARRNGFYLKTCLLAALILGCVIWNPPLLAQARGGAGRGGGRAGGQGPQGGAGNQEDMAARMREFQDRMFQEMSTFLNLNDQQKKEIRKLYDKRNEEMMKLFQSIRDSGMQPEAVRDSMMTLRDNLYAKMKASFGKEQQAKLEEWIKQENERMQQRRPPTP